MNTSEITEINSEEEESKTLFCESERVSTNRHSNLNGRPSTNQIDFEPNQVGSILSFNDEKASCFGHEGQFTEETPPCSTIQKRTHKISFDDFRELLDGNTIVKEMAGIQEVDEDDRDLSFREWRRQGVSGDSLANYHLKDQENTFASEMVDLKNTQRASLTRGTHRIKPKDLDIKLNNAAYCNVCRLI